MIINSTNLDGLFRGFNTSFNKAFGETPTHYAQVSMRVPSSTRENTYAWLGQLPRIREWIGERVIQNLAANGFTIRNRSFELTIGVDRDDISDDQYGVYGPLFAEMGREAASHPDELLFALLKSGFAAPCYDGQNFFDTDHPVLNEVGEPVSVSNMQAGAGEPWFLLDTSRAIRPLIWQEREPYKLEKKDSDNDDNVFDKNEYRYGIRARVNAGFGLWQLAFGSKAALDADSYKAARASMSGLKGDNGRPLGIAPDTLVVGPALEEAALQLLNAERTADDASNVWKGTAKLIVTPWLA